MPPFAGVLLLFSARLLNNSRFFLRSQRRPFSLPQFRSPFGRVIVYFLPPPPLQRLLQGEMSGSSFPSAEEFPSHQPFLISLAKLCLPEKFTRNHFPNPPPLSPLLPPFILKADHFSIMRVRRTLLDTTRVFSFCFPLYDQSSSYSSEPLLPSQTWIFLL